MDSQNKRPIAPDYITPESTGVESIGQLANQHHQKKQALARLVATLGGAAQLGKADMPPEQYRQAIKGDLEAQEALAQAGLINQGNIGQLYDDVMSCHQRYQGKGLVSLRICPEAKVTKYWRAVASDQAFGLNQLMKKRQIR